MGALSCCNEKQMVCHSPKKTTRNPHERNNKPKTPEIPREVEKENNFVRKGSGEVEESSKKKGRGPEDYQHVKYLGKGVFGCVVLAQEKATRKKYAMKIIEKSKIKEFNLLQCDRIKNISHQNFLVAIQETFQNETKIYVIMEYLPLGDLYYIFKKKDSPFSEETIVNIASEIIIGLEVLHKQGIVYRQLKPENILVTDEGHIKLTDYGLSKVMAPENNNQIFTFVGTLEYSAPQIYTGTFGQKADIWSLGVIIYELLFKENLFEMDHQKIMDVYEKGIMPIQRNTIVERINSKIGCMSIQLRNLLLRLLEMDPEVRIGLGELMQHEFFREVDWQRVRRRQNEPPLKEIKNKKDIITFRDQASEKYFRKQFTKNPQHENYELQLFEFRCSQ